MQVKLWLNRVDKGISQVETWEDLGTKVAEVLESGNRRGGIPHAGHKR
jgi:hypothetical protein